MTRDAKLGWVRIDVNWLDVEKTQGTFDWTVIDAVVDAARAKSLQVLAVLAYGPAWASSGDAKMDGPTNDVPIAGAYPAFVTAAVAHLKDRVTHYEIWNEPNLGQFFEGTPDQYDALVLVPGADAVHAACASCVVVAPALASIAGQYDVWLDAALTAAQDKIDVVSGHVYASFPVDDSGAGKSSDSFFDKLESHRVITLGGTVIYEGPLSFREVMLKHGATQPFWLTETGKEATYGDAAAEDLQTRYDRHVIEAMLTRDWWKNAFFYEAFDVPNGTTHWGIAVDDTSAPSGYDKKPVFDMLLLASGNPQLGGGGTECTDGLDDDGDGLIDAMDPDCVTPETASEGPPPAPDAGAPDAAAAGDAASGGADAALPGDGANGGGGCAFAASAPNGSAASLLLALAALAGGLRRKRPSEVG